MSRGTKAFKIIIMVIYSCILLYLYYILTEIGANLVIVLLILCFALLAFVGPIFRRGSKSFYKKMFPDKYNRPFDDRPKGKPSPIPPPPKKKTVGRVNLDFTHQKPLIRKCLKCKMILPSYVKKCPACGTPVSF